MHLNEIARELQVTLQELRRELAKTNFGISPSATEIDDNLSRGIIRFLKDRIKPTRQNRRVAVILKDGQELHESSIVQAGAPQDPPSEAKVPKRAMTKKEKDELEEAERKKREAEEAALRPKDPFPGQRGDSSAASSGPRQSASPLHVSRRIELGQAPSAISSEESSALPRNYYRSNKKKKRKGQFQEEAALESLQRHPGRKIKIAKVHYDDDAADNRSAEEIAIDREMDREHFRAQKKNRASNLRVGPKEQPQIKAKTGIVDIPSILSLKEFSEKCGLPVTQVISTLIKNGIIATINQKLDYDTAALVADELGVEVRRMAEEATIEDMMEGDIKKLLEEEDGGRLSVRPPVVSIMGHVDHGKTKLLDTIRSANVIDTEAGGITQHIGAYQVEKNGQKITFLDTPGHEAFTSMRARGAKATDIAILVVAADEGVKPQTIEAISHAQEAKIPILVAINKMDKPGANPDHVKGQLVEYGLQAEDWGGQTLMVPVSAMTGEGIDKLLESILLLAEVEDLKANPNRMAVGTVVEAHLDKSLGPVATILINTGTLKIGDSLVIGTTLGRVKAMHDHTGKSLLEAPPSAAVRLSGLEATPQSGELMQAFRSEQIAKGRAEGLKRLMHDQEVNLSGSMVERIVSQISTGEINFLKVVLKADTKGSLEAIMQALAKVKSPDVAIKVIHFGVGNISDGDVLIASASQALLVGFHVEANAHVRRLAERERVDVKEYTVIYKLIEDLKAILSGMLEPQINVIELGSLEIRQVFLDKKKWMILGGHVIKGKIQAAAMVRAKRGGELLFESQLDSLKHVKQDVSELEKGDDCGIRLKTPKTLQPGDVLEAFRIERIERKLE